MNLFSLSEIIISSYADIGARKARFPTCKLIFLGAVAVILVAIAAAATNTAMYVLENDSLERLVFGLVFPFTLRYRTYRRGLYV